MDIDFLFKQNFIELKDLAEEIEIEYKNKTKKELVNLIYLFFKDYEKINKKYKLTQKPHNSTKKKETTDSKKYKTIKQIGNVGKDGTTYLVTDKKNNEFAMKTFKKTKSKKSILQEVECQTLASKFNVCPKVHDMNLEENYIVMDKMDEHLYEIMKTQKGNLTKTQQQEIFDLFKKLDDSKVFHGDSNILNYMYKGNKLFMIDFGMSKKIDDALIKKLKTDIPNKKLMTLGFVLKLKELKCPKSSYSYLITKISDDDKKNYGLL